MNVYCGYDWREHIGWTVFKHSVKARASGHCNIRKLDDEALSQGTNAFTMSRFMVPELCEYNGWAVYVDACDMLCLGDLNELADYADPDKAVLVVKHDYKSRHREKYVGSDMQCPNRDYERKNWASVMLINCEHQLWERVDYQFLEGAKIVDMLQFKFLPDEAIGELPNEWNRLVDEGQPVEGAKIIHWTAGAPFVSAYYHGAPGADVWRQERQAMETS
jgi:lipopolysaccharide biosynthesis glycosyltransferase